MISDPTLAKGLSELLLNISEQLNESIAMVHRQSSADEFIAYRSAAAKVLGEILFEILNPIYAAHPTLKPPELE